MRDNLVRDTRVAVMSEASLPAVQEQSYGPRPLKVGRPSKYKPEYCKVVQDLGAMGWSKVEIASHLSVTRSTIDEWSESHPDFSEAIKRAHELAQSWWERAGREGMYADRFNARVWQKTVEARFREDYTERKVTEVINTGEADLGKAFKKRFDLSRLDSDQREQLKSLLQLAYRGEDDGS